MEGTLHNLGMGKKCRLILYLSFRCFDTTSEDRLVIFGCSRNEALCPYGLVINYTKLSFETPNLSIWAFTPTAGSDLRECCNLYAEGWEEYWVAGWPDPEYWRSAREQALKDEPPYLDFWSC